MRAKGRRLFRVRRRILKVLSALLTGMLTVFSLFSSAASGAAEPGATQSPIGYWHTSGNRIVDAHGHSVRIAAVNWFGMENLYFVPAGLDRQPLDTILARVRSFGFNTIRLPFSNQMVESNPIVRAHLNANPNLRGLHALEILDRIVAAAGLHDLRIILDNGRSSAGTYPQENGLWYTKRYPEQSWIRDWVELAQRYEGNPTVVGVDLRNEPHTAGPGPWSLQAYLHQGATWGPYRGIEDKATDWRLAAERAGNAVLAVNPLLLIIVEGLVGLSFGTQSLTFKSLPLEPVVLGPLTVPTANLAMPLSWLLIAIVVVYMLHSRGGKFLRAVGDSARVAQALGISLDAMFGLSFALGSGLAVFSAVLYGWSQGLTPLMGLNAILIGSAAVIIGGRHGVLPGAIVALALGTIQAVLVAFVPTGWQEGTTFALLLIALLIRPQGIFGYSLPW